MMLTKAHNFWITVLLALPTAAYPRAFSSFDVEAFNSAAGFSASDLVLIISVATIVVFLIWAAWSLYAVSLNTIATGNYGTWLFMIIAIICILTLVYILLF